MADRPDYAKWPRGAVNLVEQSIERHGGWWRWERGGTLCLYPVALTGFLPVAKGVGLTFPLPSRIDVELGRWRATFRDYPAAGHRGEFDRGRVHLIRDDGRTIVDAPDHRRSFVGIRKWRRWGAVDALYFFGYALSYYHAMPFDLGRLRFVRFDERRRALTVEFPPEIHTHCPVQTFFFDESGLIVRHDYTAEVVSRLARGAHRWLDYENVDGLMVARTRDVRALLFGAPTPLVALHAVFRRLEMIR